MTVQRKGGFYAQQVTQHVKYYTDILRTGVTMHNGTQYPKNTIDQLVCDTKYQSARDKRLPIHNVILKTCAI